MKDKKRKVNELQQVVRTEEYEVCVPAVYDASGQEVSPSHTETRTREVLVLEPVTRDATPEEEAEYAEERKKYFPEPTYEQKVERFIRERYSVSDELALLRQKDEKTGEYEAYYAYAEECKNKAKTDGRNSDGNTLTE